MTTPAFLLLPPDQVPPPQPYVMGGSSIGVPAWFYEPALTPVADSGYAGTNLPTLPYYTYDGGNTSASSNPPLDGGNASYVPVLCLDGGCA